jgi:hypothetical protein
LIILQATILSPGLHSPLHRDFQKSIRHEFAFTTISSLSLRPSGSGMASFDSQIPLGLQTPVFEWWSLFQCADLRVEWRGFTAQCLLDSKLPFLSGGLYFSAPIWEWNGEVSLAHPSWISKLAFSGGGLYFSAPI